MEPGDACSHQTRVQMSLGADRERGSADSGGSAAAHLALAIPGVTVSWSQTPYLFAATAASLAIHEVLSLGRSRIRLPRQAEAVWLLFSHHHAAQECC